MCWHDPELSFRCSVNHETHSSSPVICLSCGGVVVVFGLGLMQWLDVESQFQDQRLNLSHSSESASPKHYITRNSPFMCVLKQVESLGIGYSHRN